jgi:hypothetical protein
VGSPRAGSAISKKNNHSPRAAPSRPFLFEFLRIIVNRDGKTSSLGNSLVNFSVLVVMGEGSSSLQYQLGKK